MQPTPLGAASVTKRKFLYVLGALVFAVAIAAGAIFFAIRSQRQKRELILKDPGYAVGTITRKRTRKNRSITVTYNVGRQQYRCKGRVTRHYLWTHKIGDTTTVVYAKSDPSQALLRMTLQRLKE